MLIVLRLFPTFVTDKKLYRTFAACEIFWECYLQMWVYITWIFWLGIHAAWYLWLLLVGGSVPLWICFLKTWRGDPGVISATHEDKLNVSLHHFFICSWKKLSSLDYLSSLNEKKKKIISVYYKFLYNNKMWWISRFLYQYFRSSILNHCYVSWQLK